MGPANSVVRNVSDAALWVACFRARETLAGALFRDPDTWKRKIEMSARANQLGSVRRAGTARIFV